MLLLNNWFFLSDYRKDDSLFHVHYFFFFPILLDANARALRIPLSSLRQYTRQCTGTDKIGISRRVLLHTKIRVVLGHSKSLGRLWIRVCITPLLSIRCVNVVLRYPAVSKGTLARRCCTAFAASKHRIIYCCQNAYTNRRGCRSGRIWHAEPRDKKK